MSGEGLDLFKKYQDEFIEDAKVDELCLKDKVMNVVVIKHKWVARLMNHKRTLIKLKKAKNIAVTKITEKIRKGDITYTYTTAQKIAYKHDSVIKIQDEIDKTELLIEYLDHIVKIINSSTWDHKNLVEVMRMETA